MSFTALLFAELLLVTIVKASHFYGGSMTFNSRRNSDGSYKVELRFKTTYHICYPYENWSCKSGDCGNDISTVIGQVDSSPNGNIWCQSESIITKMVSTNSPFELLKSSCCWIYNTVTYSGDWSLLTYIDLGVRSDTSEPNRSPITTTLPYVRVPQNCPRRYNFLAFDPDGDQVRCRFGLRQNNECGICNQPTGFTLDQHNCSLSYWHTWILGVYSFELVLEDFPIRKITLSYTNQPSVNRYPITTLETTTTTEPTMTPEITTTETMTPEITTEETMTPEITTTETMTPEITTEETMTPEMTTPEMTTLETMTPEITTAETMTPEITTAETMTPEMTTLETMTPEMTTLETMTPEMTTLETMTPEITTAETMTPEMTTLETMTPEMTTLETMTPEMTTLETMTPEMTTAETTTTTTTTTIITTTTQNPAPETATLPLSKIPLQFSFQVDGPAPSCIEGEYLPRFLHPTPHHGEHLQAHVNHELEIRVKAFAYFSRITDVIISGPLNSTKSKTTTEEYVINWTPTTENYGQHFPFCFIAEGQNGSDIYHSEMRCVIAKVDAEGPVAHVTCTQNSMSVTIERSSIERLHGNHLRLIDPSCQVYSNGTYIFANTLLNECGTEFEENNNELIFKNKIIVFDDPRNIITRKNQLEIEILCKYHKRTNVTLEFDTHRQPVIFSEKGFGTFNYQFEFYSSETFNNRRDPNSYPLEYSVGDKIYMQIEPVTPVLNTEVFLESCVATPYDNPNYPISYPIITNGCNMDETVQFFSSHKPYVQFEMEAFKFIGLHDQVFISCSIIICEANNPNTRCSQGCVNSTVTAPSHHHSKREAPTQTGSHFISQGPLRLKRSSASEVTVSQGLSLNLVVVASCLVAAVAMVCGVIAYRSRGSIRYRTLPSHDF